LQPEAGRAVFSWRTTIVDKEPDVIILGAGVAGLAAAIELSRGGLAVAILEARDRIGGRIFTQPSAGGSPVELGAEFVHGLSPEIWQPFQEHHVPLTELSGENWCVRRGQLCACDFFAQADRILSKMDDSGPDESFLQFLRRAFPESDRDPELQEAKEWAIGYVSGFNAADSADVSVHWLVAQMRADGQIEGDRAFRPANGYETLLKIFSGSLKDAGVPVQLSTPVQQIRWHHGGVEIRAGKQGSEMSFIAPRALITLPLGVLQASPPLEGAVSFIPDLPPAKAEAFQNLAMGKVVRLTLEFRRPFWENISAKCGRDSTTLSNLSFLLSRNPAFPTWWTMLPERRPVITGWAPAMSAVEVSRAGEEEAVNKALATLSELLRFEKSEMEELLENSYFHDWQRDPYSRGAYSYARVGGAKASRALGAPVDDTLFFAGEATDVSGHNGTVHGAIASGKRAAAEILRSHLARK